MSNFKRLTGQDRLSGRKLYQNGMDFVFGGLTVVTSNFPIFHTNVGSWLTRRIKMIPFDFQVSGRNKRNLEKDFEPELGAFTSYLLSIDSERIEAVLNGDDVGDMSPTVWEAQIRSDGLAAWLNDHLIQDSAAQVRIGSDSKEWLSSEEYQAERSSLYGSYTLYCQQTKRTAKTPQNFSAELLELTNRMLGWSVEKAKVKMCGKSVRVLQGLRLRTNLDDDLLTIEEVLDKKNQGDDASDKIWDKENPVDDTGDKLGDNRVDNLEENLQPLLELDFGESIPESSVLQTEKIEKKHPTETVETLSDESANVCLTNSEETEEKVTAHHEEDDELKIGDEVIYVGKKYASEYAGQLLSIVKVDLHWTGNKYTCSFDGGWTTWLKEKSLRKVRQ